MLQSLDEIGKGKSNNLQFMKWIAASLVIISHAYPLCGGSAVHDPLYLLTGGTLSFGGVAVAFFFLSGGYFIAKSVEKKQKGRAFFAARCKRIFPPLWCVVLASILMGAFVTELPIKAYFASPDTWKYLGNGVFVLTHNLPGVFENAVYLPTVNGALWTLPVEFMCYVMCYLCYKLGFFSTKKFLLLMPPAIVTVVGLLLFERQSPVMMQILRPCVLFFIGMAFWIYRKKIKIGAVMILPCTLLLLLSFVFCAANVGMFLVFPVLCFSLWFTIKQINETIGSLGNVSYGMYLCGFPLQQLIVHLNHNNMPVYVNMLIAIPIATVIGFLLYICIEKKEYKYGRTD